MVPAAPGRPPGRGPLPWRRPQGSHAAAVAARWWCGCTCGCLDLQVLAGLRFVYVCVALWTLWSGALPGDDFGAHMQQVASVCPGLLSRSWTAGGDSAKHDVAACPLVVQAGPGRGCPSRVPSSARRVGRGVQSHIPPHHWTVALDRAARLWRRHTALTHHHNRAIVVALPPQQQRPEDAALHPWGRAAGGADSGRCPNADGSPVFDCVMVGGPSPAAGLECMGATQ